MNIIQTSLPGAVIIEPKVFGDSRGFFMETWQRDRYVEAGLPSVWVQDNLSQSRRGVLRGLHLQHPKSQGKLVTVLKGEVYDVAVDVRVGSPHFGKSAAVVLNESNKRQFYVPPGFAHGFLVTSEEALFCYKCTEFYNPQVELSVLWNDPDLKIDWPIAEPSLSQKDIDGLRLKDIPLDKLPRYSP